MPAPNTYPEAEAAIMSRFAAVWGDRAPISWPNTDPVNATRTGGQAAASWVKPIILNGEAVPARPGAAINNHFRHPGVFMVQVFAEEGRGDEIPRQHAQTIGAAFQATQDVPGIHFGGATVRAVGTRNGWYQINVSLPFWWDSSNHEG